MFRLSYSDRVICIVTATRRDAQFWKITGLNYENYYLRISSVDEQIYQSNFAHLLILLLF
jgi:hypothetical protein